MLPLRLPSTPEARAPAIATALASIEQADPGFDVDSLMRRLPIRFLDIRRVVEGGDVVQLQTYVRPSLLDRLKQEQSEDRKTFEGPPDLSVEEVRLVWAENESGEDLLTVGIDCLGSSGDDNGVQTLTAYWTLARARGDRTPADTQPDECPGCGAPVDTDGERCRYCGVLLPGPLQSWLLERVDLEIDWYDAPPGSVV